MSFIRQVALKRATLDMAKASIALVTLGLPCLTWAGLGDPERAMASVVEVFAGRAGNSLMNQGSGVVISPGRIVTNYHVVEGKTQIRIRARGRLSPRDALAFIRNIDPTRDLALLSCYDCPTPIRIAPKESFQIDDFVHAIGYPRGNRRITSGRILGVSRDPGFLVLQTSAELDFGNSGGALVDDEGRLVGINFRTASIAGKTLPLNEAIHAREVTAFADGIYPRQPTRLGGSRSRLPFHGRIPLGSGGFFPSIPCQSFPTDPILPVEGDELPAPGVEDDLPPAFVPDAAVYAGPRLGARVEKCFNVFGTLGNAGLKVVRMDPGGAAESGGLCRGDEILTMNDLPIGSATNFTGLLQAMRPGTPVVFQILREGLFREVAMTLGGSLAETSARIPAGTGPGYSLPCPDPRRLGLIVATSSFPAVSGLEVTYVVPGGPANFARLRPGDVITGLNGREPGNPYDFVLRLHSFRAGTPVQLQVHRQGKTETVTAVIRGG